MTALVECCGCYGTGVDESGEGTYLCPCCGGSGSITWRQVIRLDAVDRYPATTQLEQGAEFVREATEAISQ